MFINTDAVMKLLDPAERQLWAYSQMVETIIGEN
jgi:hypothetical protein